jgi:hypothetical protein
MRSCAIALEVAVSISSLGQPYKKPKALTALVRRALVVADLGTEVLRASLPGQAPLFAALASADILIRI